MHVIITKTNTVDIDTAKYINTKKQMWTKRLFEL